MTTTTKDEIVEEFEKIKKTEHDRISSRQDIDSKKILSADRIEDLLRFPVNSQENLLKTDRIYMTDDNRRLLLIREYDGVGSSKSVTNSSTIVSSSQKSTKPTIKASINPIIKPEETVPVNKSTTRTKRFQDSNQDNDCVVDFNSNQNNGCMINFKVFVNDNANGNHTHQIHVQANCPDFVPNHLCVNGMKFFQKL